MGKKQAKQNERQPTSESPVVVEPVGIAELGIPAGMLGAAAVDSSPIQGMGLRSVTIEIPLAVDAGNGYLSRHVDVGRLSAVQKTSLRRLTLGLVAAEERLENGVPVRTNADAVRWVLEQLALRREGGTGGN